MQRDFLGSIFGGRPRREGQGSRAERRSDLSATTASVDDVANAMSINAAFADGANRIYIDADTAMSISAVYSCVTLISDTISTIPLHLKERLASGGRQTVYNHPLALLWQSPSPKLSKISLIQALVSSVLLRGNGYAHIAERVNNRPTRLNFYLPSEVVVLKNADSVYYRITGVDGIVSSRDMIHLKGYTRDGIKGISPIQLHRENMELSAAATIFGNKFFENGCHTSGVFTYPATLKDDSYQRLSKNLAQRFSGLINAAAPMVLEGGMDYKQISMTQEDAQYLQTRKFQATEIARIFHVPPHMIGDLDKSSYNSNEQQYTEFIAMCLRPLAVKFEEELNNKLLTYAELPKYYHHFELDGLARGDLAARGEYYAKAISNGWLTPNEARSLEDMAPISGGDTLFIQANLQNITNANKIQINGKETK